MTPIETILVDIAAAGPQQEPEGKRFSPGQITHLLRIGMYVGGNWSDAADHVIHQLRSDLARLAAEIGRRDAVLRVLLDASEDGWNLKLALALDQTRKILEPPDAR